MKRYYYAYYSRRLLRLNVEHLVHLELTTAGMMIWNEDMENEIMLALFYDA